MHAAAFATLFCDLHVNIGSNGVVLCRDAEESAQLSAGRARDWMAGQLRTAAAAVCKVAHGGISRGKAHTNNPPGPLSGGCSMEEPDYRHRRLLRTRVKRPSRRRAAEQRDERAAVHSITSSASASSVGGISRSSVFA